MLFLICGFFSQIAWDTIDLAPLGIYQVSAFAVAPNGVSVLMDNAQKQLVFFDQQGHLTKRMGRSGQGPEEFAYVPEIHWYDKESCFLVFDESRSRISKWSSKDGVLGAQAVPRVRWMKNLCAINDKDLVFCCDIYGYNQATPRLERWTGEKSRSLFEVELEKHYPGTAMTTMGPFGMVNHFHPRLLFDMGTDFLAVCFNANDEIKLLDLNGRPKRIIIRPNLPHHKITRSYLESWLSEHEPFVQKMVKIGDLDTPEYLPAIDHILVDYKDRIWVFGNRQNEDALIPIQIFNPKGTLQFSIELPSIPVGIQGDQIILLTMKDDNLLLGTRKAP